MTTASLSEQVKSIQSILEEKLQTSLGVGASPKKGARSAEMNSEENDVILDAITSGLPFKDIYGISSESMEAIYAQAYEFYEDGRIEEAQTFFRFLCIYDFYNVDYAIGLGACFQLQKDYAKAIDVYASAYIIGDNDLRPVFYAGQCQLLLKELEKAKYCFELVIEESHNEKLKMLATSFLKAMEQNNETPEIDKDKDKDKTKESEHEGSGKP